MRAYVVAKTEWRGIGNGRIAATHRPAHQRFRPLVVDRRFGHDAAIVGGFGRFRGESVWIIGEESAPTPTAGSSSLRHGATGRLSKAARLMDMADHFGIPVLALIDTAGAYPGIGAEERGQAEAIARSTEACLRIGVPNVAAIIGEGGSGGAIAIATANRLIMLEHAVYSVIRRKAPLPSSGATPPRRRKPPRT